MLAIKPKEKGEAVSEETTTTDTAKPVAKTQPKASKEDISAKNLKKVSAGITDELSKHPNKANKALDKITSNNVTFVLLSYNKKTGRSLARDIINNGDKELAITKNKICHKLAQRAQQLKLKGIYFGDYMKIKDSEELIKWIEKAQNKIYAAEIKNNPAIEKEFENKKYVQVQKDSKYLKADGRKVAQEIYEQVDGPSKSYKTKSLLSQKLTSKNAAFVVTEFKNLKENKDKKSLTMRLNEEFGVDIEDIKKLVCKALVTQAKSIGLTGIYYGDYAKIKDIKTLDTWVNNTAQKIANTMNTNSVRNSKEATTTKTVGNSKTKTTTNGDLYKEAGISKVEEKYDKSGKLIDKTFYYENGKVVREYTDSKRGRVRELVKGDVQRVPSTNIKEALPITITLPDNAHKEAKEFAKVLEENKAELMAQLGIDNDTYNRYAKLAMAIAEQETDFGTNEKSTMYRQGKYYAGMLVEGGAQYGGPTTVGTAASIAKQMHDFSYGPTQIKLEKYKKDEWCAEQFKHFGIENGLQLYDNKNAAIATIIVLAHTDSFIKGNNKYQQGMEAARGNVVTVDGWEMKDGTLQKTYNTKSFVNKVTDDDAICYFWNGRGVQIEDGTAEPESLEYTRNIHKLLKNYEIKEDTVQKEAALKHAQNSRVIYNFKPMDNNGPIGSIVFMPKMYTGNLQNKQDEIEILKNCLSQNDSIDENSKQALIKAVSNGEIAFEFGLTEREAQALTQDAVNKLLKHLNSVKSTLEKDGIDFTDGISRSEANKMAAEWQDTIRQAEFNFKREYLNSISKKVKYAYTVPERNVLQTPLNNSFEISRMHRSDNARRGFVGYHEYNGINYENTTKASAVLAENAENVASRTRTSGKCLGSFRIALLEAGIDIAYGDFEEGTPRAAAGWLERHPDMFEEVMYIKVDDNNLRQINATDLANLPAGYIVLWIPDKISQDGRFAKEPGHACITDGFGGANADEKDNLNWGVYREASGLKNGKGEHGVFRVFRLSDKWEVDPETNKLVFPKK